MHLEAIKNTKHILKKGYYKFKKALCSFKYHFLFFFLFEDWVLETQLRIEFLTPNTGVWNQLYKILLHKCIKSWKNNHWLPCCVNFLLRRNKKLRTTLQLCVDGFLGIFAMWFISPLGVMFHSESSVYSFTSCAIFVWLIIFRHSVTKTQILSKVSLWSFYDASH